MAVAYVKSASHYDGGFWNSVSLATVGQGNLLVMLISGSEGQNVTGVTTTAGTTGTWTQAGSREYTTGSVQIDVWYCYHTGSSETVSAVPTGDAADSGYSMHEYSGIATSSPLFGSAQYDEIDSGTTFATPNISSIPADAVLVAMWASEYSSRTITWTNFTQRTAEGSHYHFTADRVISAGGDYNCAGSMGSDTNRALIMVVCFQGPASGATGNPYYAYAQQQ